MASASKPIGSRETAEHRARLRAQGLRPIQIWVPDIRAASFKVEASRQSSAVSSSVHRADDQEFIDAVTDCGEA